MGLRPAEGDENLHFLSCLVTDPGHPADLSAPLRSKNIFGTLEMSPTQANNRLAWATQSFFHHLRWAIVP
jgi:hypothetical protein